MGLLATQGIRGGANRQVLEGIKRSGDIFFAVSDRDWVLNGANVHISMVGFDDGSQAQKVLDGAPVPAINSDLTRGVDVTRARKLQENKDIAFMGDTKGGAFDISESAALPMLHAPNPHGKPGSDVLVPWVNGADLTGRPRGMWIIDFGTMNEDDAALYESPYKYLQHNVFPARQKNAREAYRLRWWQHVEARPRMLKALAPLPRFLATATTTKHRLFVWMEAPTLPDHALIVFARSDDYFFGILHSRFHELWARRQGTQLRERESGFRYTPETCFLTFPFPRPTPEQQAAIAEAAKKLNGLRENWLNPPQWTREEVLQFPGSTSGPWARFVHGADDLGLGTVRYTRRVLKDPAMQVPAATIGANGAPVTTMRLLAHEMVGRTLTNLYNARPMWLQNAHRELDQAVAGAYGWSPDLSDEEILEHLLALNQSRATL